VPALDGAVSQDDSPAGNFRDAVIRSTASLRVRKLYEKLAISDRIQCKMWNVRGRPTTQEIARNALKSSSVWLLCKLFELQRLTTENR
jgi:hypothetical protein